MSFIEDFVEYKKIFLEKAKESNFKAALLCTADKFLFYLYKNIEEIKWQRVVSVLVVHFGFLMDANDYLFDTFDQEIKKLLPTGLLVKGNIEIDPPNYRQPKKEATAKALSMGELAIAFKASMICLAISFTVFVLEHSNSIW